MNILDMLVRRSMRRILNWGVKKGVDTYARKTGDKTSKGPATAAGKKANREAVKRARLAAQLTRTLRR